MIYKFKIILKYIMCNEDVEMWPKWPNPLVVNYLSFAGNFLTKKLQNREDIKN